MANKKFLLAGIVTLALGSLVVSWMVSFRGRPQAVGLLELLPPGADVYGVVNVEGLQSNSAVRKLLSGSVEDSEETEYKRFLRNSGFRYQDHLKQLAFAKFGPDWLGVARVEVDRPRMVSYLESQGAEQSQEGAWTAYAFGTQRPFRLVFLDDRRVAFTVGSDSSLLSQPLERSLRSSGDSAASELRRTEEPQSLPGQSELWVMARFDRLLDKDPEAFRYGLFQLGGEWLQGSKSLYLRVESSPIQLEMQLEDRCDSAASAERIARWAKALLAILSTPPSPEIQSGSDYTPLLRAVTVSQLGESVFLHWRWDPSMLASLNQGPR